METETQTHPVTVRPQVKFYYHPSILSATTWMSYQILRNGHFERYLKGCKHSSEYSDSKIGSAHV